MLSQLRIVYILNSPTKHGGANKSFLYMLEGLIAKGVVPLVVLPKHGELCGILEKWEIPYAIIPFYLSIYPSYNNLRDIFLFIPRLLRTIYSNFRATKKLIYHVKKFKPILIHTNVGPLHIGYIVSKILGISHVWHIREYQVLDFDMHPFPSMSSFLNILHTTNNFPIAITNGIYKYFNMGGNARIISNPVFNANCTQFILNKNKYFLFAGRLEKNKGIKDLIVAFAEFAKVDSKYLLYVAGNTSNIRYKKALVSLADRIGIIEKVKFLGMRDDISDLMAQATALIVPSLHEGFGRITVEAMFNGCLVIGNNSGGTKEILEKENLGVLYSGHDDLVACMKRVVSNGIESYFPVIRKAQERAVALYSIEQNVSAVYNFYRDILYKKNGKTC